MKFLKKTVRFFRDFYRMNTSEGGFHQEEAELYRRYTDQKKVCGKQSFSIVVCVDGAYQQGGLSDRIRGMVSVYLYCKQHHIPFRIHSNYPFDLKDYLEPNDYDWYISPKEVSHHPEEATPMLLYCHLLNHKFHRRYLDKRVKEAKKDKKQLHIYTNTFIEDKHYSAGFNELFKPTPRLQEMLQRSLEKFPQQYVASVLRFQQLLGDFEEENFEILPENERKLLIDRCCRKIEELHNTRHSDKKMLVTSDSTTFLQTLQERYPDFILTIPGKVVHMDYTTDADFPVYAKSFVDMFMVARARHVYLLRTGKMYRSGFAKRAALMTDTPYEEIAF